MLYNTLKNRELKLSAITFGAWAIGGWMWGGADKHDALDALAAAIDNGISTIDTAPVYGFGQSEELVGKAIKGKRDKIQLLTKFGLRWDGSGKGDFFFDTKSNKGQDLKVNRYASKESIIVECESSLRLLGTDYIDLYQIHWSDPTTPITETMEAMALLHKQGKIRYAGVCNYNLDQVKEALKHFPIATIQNPYSMLRRDIEDELMPFCAQNNIGVLAYSPLQRGILTGKIKPGYQFNEGDTRPKSLYYQEPNLTSINTFIENTLHPLAQKYNASVGQVVINWTIQQAAITTALVGARNRQQVMDNVKAVDFMLNKNELLQIDKMIKELKIQNI